jgi:hypothetical protein
MEISPLRPFAQCRFDCSNDTAQLSPAYYIRGQERKPVFSSSSTSTHSYAYPNLRIQQEQHRPFRRETRRNDNVSQRVPQMRCDDQHWIEDLWILRCGESRALFLFVSYLALPPHAKDSLLCPDLPHTEGCQMADKQTVVWLLRTEEKAEECETQGLLAAVEKQSRSNLHRDQRES